MKTLDPIFPITALQKKTAEVRNAAQNDIIRITENGVGAYIFASEEAFERHVNEAVRAAVEEALIANAVDHGKSDFSAGKFKVGSDAWDEIKKRAKRHA